MHPELFTIGPLSLHSFGTVLAATFLLALLLTRRRAIARGMDKDLVLDLFQVILISSIIGARLAYVLPHLEQFEGRMWSVLAIWQGGMTLYGGILLAILSAWIFLRRRGVNFLEMADIVAPGLALGIVLGRVGCLLNGCCFGKPSGGLFGIHFPAHSEASRVGKLLLEEQGRLDLLASAAMAPRLHPTQIYSSLGAALILLLLLILEKRRPGHGMVFGAFLFLYGIHRFIIDQFRYYEEAMRALSLSLNQWLSIALILAGLALFFRSRSKA